MEHDIIFLWYNDWQIFGYLYIQKALDGRVLHLFIVLIDISCMPVTPY